MARKKKQAWTIGDVFWIPLADGTYSIGQVVGRASGALNSAVCAFFSRRFDTVPTQLDSQLSEGELLSMLFVTRDLLDSGHWRVFSGSEAFPIKKHLNINALKDNGFVGVDIIGSGIPARFDFVRTELVYVPSTRRREYIERLLEHVVAPGGRLIVCSYGSSRPEGARAENLIDEIVGWGIPIAGVHDTVSQEHRFVITRVVSIAKSAA